MRVRSAFAIALLACALAAVPASGGDDDDPRGGETAAGAARGIPTGDGQGGFRLQRVAGFDKPLYAHGPKGGGDIVFVVEREGRVKIIDGNRKRKGTFLDIREHVACCESERGLFSIAFPDYDDARRFYVYYTDDRGDLRVDEFRRKKGSRFRAAEGSRRRVLDIPHRQAANHNGGTIQFGPGGKLFVATGDGATGGETAQRRSSLLGKLLRINPTRHGKRPYGVPRSNPYVGEPGEGEIFARGLRNPFRFSFDRDRILIGDVGQDRREEVDFEGERSLRGANFGWNAFEGTLRYDTGTPVPGNHDRPIHQYDHSGGRCAITGGYVSRDRRIGSLYGRYVYGDLCTGELRSLVSNAGGSSGDRALGVGPKPGLVGFGEDDRSRLYVVQQSGGVFRIVPD